MNFTAFVIPALIAGVFGYGMIKGVDVFDEFLNGAKENLKVGFQILPALIALMTAVGMFKASGALELLTGAIKPVTDLLQFPGECVPLVMLRPVSGSGALAVYEKIISSVHPDSYAGRVASVLMGSTETTFYTMAVYFSVTKVKKTRHTLFCAMAADITGFLVSALVVRTIWG